MTRHNFDGRIMDFTWKQNRLSKDKEALKNSMMNVIRKKPKMQVNNDSKPRESGNDQGYGVTAKKEALGERGMIVDSNAQQSPPEYNQMNRASAAATKQISNINRGSEFKKNAQQMLNK